MKIINDDLEHAPLKEGETFPILTLQTTELNSSKLSIPKAEYILINFWFSRCKPCLEEIPDLKRIYKMFHSKRFEIVNISTDNIKDVPVWQERIMSYGLTWPQYLDQNAINASRLGISTFPRFILLNGQGKIVGKPETCSDLEMLLKQKYSLIL